jgi:hypothetical protein
MITKGESSTPPLTEALLFAEDPRIDPQSKIAVLARAVRTLQSEVERKDEALRKIVAQGGSCLTYANDQQYNDAKVRAAEFVLYLARAALSRPEVEK